MSNRTNPAVPVFRGNHNGGVMRVGPDGKLYLIMGDNGRRGLTAEPVDGPFVTANGPRTWADRQTTSSAARTPTTPT